MRKALFAALLISLAVSASALLSEPASAVNNQTGGASSGRYCTGSLKACLAGCRSGQSPANYTYCHTNCILLNQNCLGYPTTAKPKPTPVSGPIQTKPIGTKPVENTPVIEERGHSRH
jgi:hypothetical protein